MATAHLEHESGAEYDAPFETTHVYLSHGWAFALPEDQAVYEAWKAENDARLAAELTSVADLEPAVVADVPIGTYNTVPEPVVEDKKKK